MADCAALEMLCTARYRGFESLSLRHFPNPHKNRAQRPILLFMRDRGVFRMMRNVARRCGESPDFALRFATILPLKIEISRRRRRPENISVSRSRGAKDLNACRYDEDFRKRRTNLSAVARRRLDFHGVHDAGRAPDALGHRRRGNDAQRHPLAGNRGFLLLPRHSRRQPDSVPVHGAQFRRREKILLEKSRRRRRAPDAHARLRDGRRVRNRGGLGNVRPRALPAFRGGARRLKNNPNRLSHSQNKQILRRFFRFHPALNARRAAE